MLLIEYFSLIKTNLGTFGKTDEEPFDLILTNPPYVTNSSANIKKATKDLKGKDGKPYFNLKGRGVETIALEWIIKNLKLGGEALVVVPDGLLAQKSVLNYIKQKCVVNAVISLPKNTFYATSKKTYIINITRKDKPYVQDHKIFTFVVGEIGETRDTKRFTTDEEGKPVRNDLDECVTHYNLFKNGIETFNSIRTKLIDFETFNSFEDWLIEKKLSDDEKIAIGLIKPVQEITEDEFISELSLIRSEIDTFVKVGKTEPLGEVRYVNKKLNEIFVFPAIKGLTEKFIRNHTGKIPVYGGRQFEEPVGYIEDNIPGVKYFENCLAWNREGSVGYVFYHNHRFTTNDHHRPMMLRAEYEGKINLKYVKEVLEQILLNSDLFEWSKTASKEKVREIEIQIPIDTLDNIDHSMQERLVERLSRYRELKERLDSDMQQLINKQMKF